jgi:hypothetical protein
MRKPVFRHRDKVELFDLMLADPRVKSGKAFSVSFGDVYLDAVYRSAGHVLNDHPKSCEPSQSTEAI